MSCRFQRSPAPSGGVHAPRRLRLRLLLALCSLAVSAGALASGGLLDHRYRPLAGKQPVDLAATYGGDVVLVVNTASKCGFTPQFEALEGLHAKYKAKGFAVLGFPSGDFMEQEFTDEKKIQEFCTLTYGVKFPMFEKVHVVGPDATALYKQLKAATGSEPKWNFHKYLLGRDGRVVATFGSDTTPDAPAVVAAIEKALAAPRPAGKRLPAPSVPLPAAKASAAVSAVASPARSAR